MAYLPCTTQNGFVIFRMQGTARAMAISDFPEWFMMSKPKITKAIFGAANHGPSTRSLRSLARDYGEQAENYKSNFRRVEPWPLDALTSFACSGQATSRNSPTCENVYPPKKRWIYISKQLDQVLTLG
jgi:hypothetical protein